MSLIMECLDTVRSGAILQMREGTQVLLSAAGEGKVSITTLGITCKGTKRVVLSVVR